jgi:23S rRNA pseudouridine2605 synthase/16S rRNA pseudouridine516 synthase
LKDAEAAIRAGRVRLDGRVVLEPLTQVSGTPRVQLDDRVVTLSVATLVLAFHKAKGLVTHGSDPEGVGTVFDALLSRLPPNLSGYGWHAVGRLDRDTTGLLLFTNDERFVAHATSPKTHLEKCYVATVSGSVTPEKLRMLESGVVIDDGPVTRPARAILRTPGVVELVLTEGRYHQVKRMLNCVGLPTLALHRERVGSVVLDVPELGFRLLSDDEINIGLRFVGR